MIPGCPSQPSCCEGLFDYNIPSIFYSSPVTGNCPDGYGGGPFVSKYGQFTSSISQEDANAKAQEFIDAQLVAGCVQLVPVVTSDTLDVSGGDLISYQINATNFPTSYGSTLPFWLSMTAGGLITGTAPDSAETVEIPISATNNAGTGFGTLTINITIPSTIEVTFSNHISGFATLDVSVDGAAYAPVDFLQTYAPTSQFKYKMTVNPGTFIPHGFLVGVTAFFSLTGTPTITSGSSTANGSISATGSPPNIIGIESPLFGSSQSLANNNGIFSVTETESGAIPSSSDMNISFNIINTISYTVTSGFFETILNF